MKAVRFYGVNDQGIPAEWPVEMLEISAASDAPAGYTVMSDVDMAAHIAAYRGAYDGWRAVRAAEVEGVEAAGKIRAEAQRRIVALLGHTPDQIGEWAPKQINMTAKGARLARKEFLGTITAEEAALLVQLEGFFDRVEAIRAFSNTLEAQWAGGQRPDIYTGWPY